MERLERHRMWVLGVMFGLGVLLSSIVALFGEQSWDAFFLNLGTELIGGVVAYIALGMAIGQMESRVAKQEVEREEKARLIAQMSSSVRDVAVPAVDELRRRGWLTDGSLHRADLSGADLGGADLTGATLTDEQLAQAASLEGATMPDGTKLRGPLWKVSFTAWCKQRAERRNNPAMLYHPRR